MNLLQSATLASEGYEIEVIDGDLANFTLHLAGPSDTIWKGGVFKLNVHIPSSYPFKAPRIHFVTKIWHPNIQINGYVSLGEWSPVFTLAKVIGCIVTLLTEPSDNCLNHEAAHQYKHNRRMYDSTVREWVTEYATYGGSDFTIDTDDPCFINSEDCGHDSFFDEF